MSTLTKGAALGILDRLLAESGGGRPNSIAAQLRSNGESLRAHIAELHDEADRMQSAHDAETKELRECVAKLQSRAMGCHDQLQLTESRLREAHGLLRECVQAREGLAYETELLGRIDRAMELAGDGNG